jgi:hypothetical protein
MAQKDIEKYQFDSKQSRTKAAENGRKGGIASGKAKREKRTWRQIAETIGQMQLHNKKQIQSVKDFLGELTGEATHDDAVIASAYEQAATGNVNAMRFIADLKGEIVNKQEIEQKITDYTLEEKRKQIQALIKELMDE